MFEKDSLIVGLLFGIAVPFIGYALWLELYDQLEIHDFISGRAGVEFRRRTSSLLGICMNLIPFTYFNRQRFFGSMRGVVFSTIVYGFIWFFYFWMKS